MCCRGCKSHIGYGAHCLRGRQRAIDNVELGNLTGLLNKIKPAIDSTQFDGEKSGKNEKYVDAVAKNNVKHTIDEIRKNSEIINKLEKEGKIIIVGSMYNLNGGKVDFFM